MSDNNGSNGQTGETAWGVAMVSAVLVLGAALGILVSIKAFLFFLSQLKNVFSFLGSGVLLFMTLANVIPVFLVALAWLWSFQPRTLFTKNRIIEV